MRASIRHRCRHRRCMKPPRAADYQSASLTLHAPRVCDTTWHCSSLPVALSLRQSNAAPANDRCARYPRPWLRPATSTSAARGPRPCRCATCWRSDTPLRSSGESLSFADQGSAGFQVVVYALRQPVAGSPLPFPARQPLPVYRFRLDARQMLPGCPVRALGLGDDGADSVQA